MNPLLTARILFALAASLIVLANTAVLLGVSANRRGEPESRLVLSERELRHNPRVDRENSGVALQLIWRTLGADHDRHTNGNWQSPAWLDSTKMEELGFDPAQAWSGSATDRRWRRPPSQEMFVVLEHDGSLYREALLRAEADAARERTAILEKNQGKRAQELLEAEKRQEDYRRATESRLFAIDAGKDLKSLRQRYPDRTRYLIVRGSITPLRQPTSGREGLIGTISRLSVGSIHVPRQFRPIFDGLATRQGTDAQRPSTADYSVELAFGSRLEPWILAVNAKGDDQ